MNTLAKALLAGLTGAALVPPASAAILSFTPLNSSVNIGDSVTVSVVISGLSGPIALGGYQLSVSYDAARVQVTGVSFPAPPWSGLDLGMGSLNSFDLSSPGIIALDEVSFELPATLATDQPDAFTLAQLTFKGLTFGQSPLGFSLVDLSDAGGAALGAGMAFAGAINVVPEASEWVLMSALGLVGFAAWRRRSL
ncbi:MAG: hypothetical protein IPM17_13555 [Verrucomicrobia bacterium]|nr:hypothetical protein [Verrucomicrobiota bacterium]